MSCDEKLHSVSLQHILYTRRQVCTHTKTLTLAECTHGKNVFLIYRYYNNCSCICTELKRFMHAYTSKHSYQIISFGCEIKQKMSLNRMREERERDLCERNQPSSSPSVRVLSFFPPALTHCPVNRLRPTAQLNATTCYPRVSAYASLGLISSDKSNISGEFTPLGLTCRMTSNCTADCMALRSVTFPAVTWYMSESWTHVVFLLIVNIKRILKQVA